MNTHKKQAFTLIEIITSILVVALILLGAFQAMTSLWFGKIRLMQKTTSQKQMLYFSEKLFEMIKYWGTLDFEEYFNRKIVNQLSGTNYASGHYAKPTGYGNYWPSGTPGTINYWNGYYYCISKNWQTMGDNGCVNNFNINSINSSWTRDQDYRWNPQTYGQYSFQFRDYNSNANADDHCTTTLRWDQNCNGNIIGDDDDNYFGKGPSVFSTGSTVAELYLLNGVKRQRTFFRYVVNNDPDAPTWSTCNSSDGWKSYTGTWCLGNIEYLIMDGRDWWLDHVQWNNDITENDWVIDTWLINEKFLPNMSITIAGSNNPVNGYWQPLFPDNIHVTEFSIYPHPNIDEDRAWAMTNEDINVSQYVRIKVWMQPAWRDRKALKGIPREYMYTTTINLTDIFSR